MNNLKKILVMVIGFGAMTLFTGCGNNASTTAAAAAACQTGYTYNGSACVYTGTSSTASYVSTTGTCQTGYTYSSGTCYYTGTTTSATSSTHTPYEGSCAAGLVQVNYVAGMGGVVSLVNNGGSACLQPSSYCGGNSGYALGTYYNQYYCFQASASY